MSQLRDKILGAKVREKTETIEGVGPVLFKGITAGAKGRIYDATRIEDTDKTDAGKYHPALVIESAHDPETGEKLFTSADIDALTALPADVIEAMAAVAAQLSGLDKQATERLEKN